MACPVSLEFRDSTSLFEYESTELVQYIHSLPRFGISKDLEEFINDDESSYLLGVSTWSIVLSIVLTMYLVILYICNPSPSSVKQQRRQQQQQQQQQQQHRSRRPQTGNLKRLNYQPQDVTLNRAFFDEEDDRKPDPDIPEQQQQAENDRFSIKSLIDEKRPPFRHPSDIMNVSDSVLGSSCLCFEEQEAEKEDLKLFFEGVIDDDDEDSFPETTTSNFLFQDDATEGSTDKNLVALQEADPTATLPKSKFISRAASRKRLLESYFASIMNTSTMLTWNLFGVNYNSQREYPALPPAAITSTKQKKTRNHASRPRQTWTFAQVFSSPRAEEDDGSTFQPQKKKRNQIDSSIDSSRSAANHQDDDNNPNEEPSSDSLVDKQLEADTPKTATSSPCNNVAPHHPPRRPPRWLLPKTTIRNPRHNWNGTLLLQRFRILTVIAGSILMLSAMLLITKGVLQLDAQAESMTKEWQQLRWSSMETKGIIDTLQQLQPSLYEETLTVYRLLDQHCPAIRTDICSEDQNCNVKGIPLESNWEALLDSQIQPRNVLNWIQAPNWTSAQADLDRFESMPVETTLDSWRWALAASTICNILLFVLVFLILWAIAMPKCQFTFQEYFISTSPAFPWLFWLLTLAGWAFAILFLVGSFVASDACVESPSAITAKLFLGNGTHGSGYESFLPTTFWEYYLEGCPLDAYPSTVQDEVSKWAVLIPPTNALNQALNELSEAEFDILCTTDGGNMLLNDLQAAVSTLSWQLCGVTQSMVSLREMLRCKWWYPHFQSMAYKSTCLSGTEGIGWAAMAQWIVVIMSLTIWTFREAFRADTDLSSTRTERRNRCQVDWRRSCYSCTRRRRRKEDILGSFPMLTPNSTEESSSSTPGRSRREESLGSFPKPIPAEQMVSNFSAMDEQPSYEVASTVTPDRSRREETLGSIPNPTIPAEHMVSNFSSMDEQPSDEVASTVTPDRSRCEETQGSIPIPALPAGQMYSNCPSMDEQSWDEVAVTVTPDRSRREETLESFPNPTIPAGQMSSYSSLMDDQSSDELVSL